MGEWTPIHQARMEDICMAFMETIDNLRDKVVAAGKDVSEKAKEAAAIAKLQTQISVEKSKLKSLYTDLGKAFYEDPESEEIEIYKDSIDAIMEVIASFERELASLKGLKHCEGCGAPMAKEVLFCSKCGTKNEIPEEAEEDIFEDEVIEIVEESAKTCPVCEAEVSDDMAFCEVCGTKLED